MELRLKNVASYNKKDYTRLNLASKTNIIYGQNGVGKSTVSNFFYNVNEKEFKDCECSEIENYRTIVYNSRFIEDNFYNKNEQKGIFTLSKGNAEIEKEIFELENSRKSLLEAHKVKKEILSNLQRAEIQAENTCIDNVWLKAEKIRNSQLRDLMRGSIGSKRDFYLKIKSLPALPEIDLEALADEYSELLKHKNSELSLIIKFQPQQLSTEEVTLLQLPIIDSSNSYLSEVIKKLDNLDWVKKGKDSYLEDTTCPFCQEDTISPEFIKAIESIFDESYSNKINKITSIKKNYSIYNIDLLDKIKKDISSCELLNEQEKEISLTYITVLTGVSNRNLEFISNKVTNPSIIVVLEEEPYTVNALEMSIEKYNKKITEVNEKVKKFKISENDIKGKIWSGLRDFCNVEYAALNSVMINNKVEAARVNGELKTIVENGTAIRQEIKSKRDQVSNIDSTIVSINSRLKILGIHGFSIDVHAENKGSYIITRPENNHNVYKSLSEGEKTLITFLYFIEYCKGRVDKDEEDNKDIFVIIDDPISSLSQNYIYDIASLINFELIQDLRIKKTLTLTHNLYFFHELIKLAPKSKGDKIFKRDYKLTRITKNEFSVFSNIEKNNVLNEYQSLWQILKDAIEGNVNNIIIPNVMRNILEYYFGFVHKTDELQSALNNLAKDEEHVNFRPFYRFINRGSHSDSVNITDMGEISPEVYINQMRNIFSILGDEQHFIKMIDEKENEEDVVTT